MPLTKILARLTPSQRETLAKPHYFAVCQRTFEDGTIEVLGQPHEVYGIPVLDESGAFPVVRFSHKNVLPDQLEDEDGERDERAEKEAMVAHEAFINAAKSSAGVLLPTEY